MNAKKWLLLLAANVFLYYCYVPNPVLQPDRQTSVADGRRAFLVLFLLQGGVALGRGAGGKVCTMEEMQERNDKVLKAKGFKTKKE